MHGTESIIEHVLGPLELPAWPSLRLSLRSARRVWDMPTRACQVVFNGCLFRRGLGRHRHELTTKHAGQTMISPGSADRSSPQDEPPAIAADASTFPVEKPAAEA